MQKLVRFLEANVEWFALAFAVGYLGWVAWSYLITDPTGKAMPDGTMVNVGNVDEYVDSHAAQHLRDKMNPDTPVPEFEVKDFSKALASSINLENLQPTQLATADFDYSPFDTTNQPGTPGGMVKGNPVEQLPSLPAAKSLLAAAGLNTLAPANGGNGAAPVGNPPPAGNGAAGASAPTGKDVRLVVAAFTIPWSDLFDQWNKAFGPAQPGGQPRLNPAEFQLVQITAYRSEKVGDKWIDEPNPVQIINGQGLPAYPPALNKQAELSYLEALQKTPKTIATPDIPQVSFGATWKDPIQFLPGAGEQNNPTTPPPDQNSYLPGSNYPGKSAMADGANSGGFKTVDVQYRGGGGFQGPPGGFRGGAPPVFRPPVAPSPDQNPEQPPQPPPTITPADGTVTPVTALANPNPPAAGQQLPQEASPKLNIVAMQPKGQDLCIYIVDETALPGRTYRYRIVYKALNPLYNKGAQHVSQKHQAWLNQFDLASPMSEWSPEITVPKQTYFFCGTAKGVIGGGPAVTAFPFEVFTWSNGKWQKDTFNASLGDPIGGLVGAIDYATGYTYVQRRLTHNNTRTVVLVVDAEGNVVSAPDSSDPYYKKVTQWMTLPANVPGQAAPVNPGYPGGFPGGFPGGAPGPYPGGFGPGGFNPGGVPAPPPH